MDDDSKRIELIRMVLGRDWEPPKQYPVTFHNRQSGANGNDQQVPELTRVDSPSQAKSLREFIGRQFSNLKRSAQAWLSRRDASDDAD